MEVLTNQHVFSQNNPLHISIFPSYDPAANSLVPVRTPLQFSLLLSSTLDVFELRAKHNALNGVGLTGDYGLLHAVDERLASYGYETNTGVKFVVVVDMRGQRVDASVVASAGERGRIAASAAGAVGLREGEMKIVSFLFFPFFSLLLEHRVGGYVMVRGWLRWFWWFWSTG
jgi:hypothetical protein